VEQLRFLSDQSYTGSIILISGSDEGILDAAAAVAKKRHLHIEATLRKPVDFDKLRRILTLQQVGQPKSTPNNRNSGPTEHHSSGKILAALRDDQIGIVLQPIVSRYPWALNKLEALVRWYHPLLGTIPPDEFIPIAEGDQTCMELLTDRVIDHAIHSILQLRQHSVEVPISVNLSARSLYDTALPSHLAARLKSAGVHPSLLCVELTEKTAVQDFDATREILLQMRLRGIQVALDDFGIGHSSLIALRQLPFSEIKIDQSFVKDMNASRTSFAIVKSIIQLAAEIGATSVAEGVEHESNAQVLEDLGIGGLQGYLFGRGMVVTAVPQWHASWIAMH
jgi:EAL domain-containing protein (putative c-di-GMP-specific phosphodiesterase class I)